MVEIAEGILLKDYSTFRIGGPARYFTAVRSPKEMQEAFLFAQEHTLPFYVLGKGSNTLFDDRGFNGLVIYNKIDHCTLDQNRIAVGGGYSFSLLGIKTSKAGLSGLEFASGIPGSVGGAIYMNAGANGAQAATCIDSVTYLHAHGELKRYAQEELTFTYRTSSFQKMEGAILEAVFILPQNRGAHLKQKEIVSQRIQTQPYHMASCGCVFKNFPEVSAGKLIDACGLKGLTVGGAAVSPLHANFIVNMGTATCADVLELIRTVRAEVERQQGLTLQTEILYLSYET